MAAIARRFDDVGVNRLDERGFAHAARAPEQGVVGRKAGGKAFCIVAQNVADMIDAAYQRKFDPVDAVNGGEAACFGLPYKTIGRIKISVLRSGGREARNRLNQTLQIGIEDFEGLVAHLWLSGSVFDPKSRGKAMVTQTAPLYWLRRTVYSGAGL